MHYRVYRLMAQEVNSFHNVTYQLNYTTTLYFYYIVWLNTLFEKKKHTSKQKILIWIRKKCKRTKKDGWCFDILLEKEKLVSFLKLFAHLRVIKSSLYKENVDSKMYAYLRVLACVRVIKFSIYKENINSICAHARIV